jgi:hypothetical protein
MTHPPIGFFLLPDGEALPGGATHPRIGLARAYVKHNSIAAPYCVANEIICGRLAQHVGLPVPAFCAGLHQVEETADAVPSFVTMAFLRPLHSAPPVSPARARRCVKSLPFLTTGALLFDILIANGDRHHKNVHYREADPEEFILFDHSHALFGNARFQVEERLNELQGRLGITGSATSGSTRHIFLDPLRELRDGAHIPEWVERIKSIPNWLIQSTCKEAQDLAQKDRNSGISDAERRAVVDFLSSRRTNIDAMINQHPQELAWGRAP